MPNIFTIITLLAIVIAGSLLGWLAFTGKVKIGDVQKVCQPAPLPADLAQPPPGVIPKDRATVTVDDGRFSIALQPLRKVLYVKGPVITLVVNSVSRFHHNFVLAYNSGNCYQVDAITGIGKGEEIRRVNDVLGTVDNTIRVSLTPGEYLLYCDLKNGARTHRELGEELKMVVY